MLLCNFFFDGCNQLTWHDFQCLCDAPQGFHIGLLGTIFNHRQMASCDTGKTTEQFLRHMLLRTHFSDYITCRIWIIMHETTAFPQLG